MLIQDQLLHPKVKPRTCITDECQNTTTGGPLCPNCEFKKLYIKKGAKKQKWQAKKTTPLDKAIAKSQRGEVTAEKLYKTALTLWSNIVRGQESYTACATCNKPIKARGDGLLGAHAGHYLDKSNHWKLSLEVENGLPQCKGCNCDFIHNPRRIEVIKIEMRQAMIAAHGKDIVDELDRRGEELRIAIKQGKENIKPRTHDPLAVIYGRMEDMEFLKLKIKELKNIIL